MKDNNEVISEFNELVNMTAADLEKWLKSDDSNSAGWPKENEDGETVGHDSGRKIVEILKENPDKDPEKYTEDQVSHMRKVVAYCKRHLAQETKGNNEKSPEEVKKTKSYASLKNWGHDFLKAQNENKTDDEDEVEDEAGDADDVNDKDQDVEEKEEDDQKKAGDKRKAPNGQSGSVKKRETRQGESKKKDDEVESEEVSEEDEDNSDDEDAKPAKKSNGQKSNGKKEDNHSENGAQANNGPKKGDTVSWNWGGGQPEGKVLDVKGEKTTITTKNGNQVSRKGNPEDPAVVLDAGKSKAIKANHELN